MATTSGLIQRLKWVQGAHALFVYVGPAAGSSQLMLLMFNDPDAAILATRRAIAAVLAKAFGAALPVSLLHDPGASTIDGVDLGAALVQVDGVEITQAIQSLANTIGLIANKGTVARLYLSSRLTAPITVRGTLRVTRGGAASLVPSSNSVLLDPADFGKTDAKRLDAAKTLNFLLPAGTTTIGSADVRLAGIEESGSGAQHAFTPPGTLATPVFLQTPPLRITLIGFSYAQGMQTFTPTTLDFTLVQSWLRRAYPVGDLIWSQRTVAATATVPFGCGDINSQLAAIRALDVAAGTDARTHYYGLVSDGGFFMRGCAGVPATPDPGAVGSGPTGPSSWGWDFDGSYGDWYCGHELGHTFGRLHPGFCGETADDLANYPFDNGQLSDADGYFSGFDVGDAVNGLAMAALPGVQWHDVMTYCDRQWLSSYTYQGIRTRLIAEDALPAAGASMGAGRPDARFRQGDSALAAGSQPPTKGPRRLVQVIARVNLSKQSGSIDYVLPLDGGEPSAPDGSSRVVLATSSADGETLDRIPVRVTPEADEGHGPDQRGFVSAIVAVHPDAARLELEVEGRRADAFDAGAPAATPRAMSFEATPDGISLRWEADSPAGAGVSYSTQLSADGGRTWQTVAVGLASPEAAIDTATLPGNRPVRVRIRASGGFQAVEREFEFDPSRAAQGSAPAQPQGESRRPDLGEDARTGLLAGLGALLARLLRGTHER
jgi:hypothetical protein